MNNVIRFVTAVAVCQLAGLIGSVFTRPAIPGWYAALSKPSFSPPNWVFAPVWTTLFLLMGIALYLVWTRGLGKAEVRTAMLLFGGQLVLNVLWSVLFFGLHLPLYAFMEIVVLWVAILLTIIYFWRVTAAAGILLLPYLLWVSFATVLNFSLWRLNP